MEVKSDKDVMKALKAKDYMPVYVLHGEEPFFIDQITSYIEKNVLNEGEKAFNMSVLYGRDVDSKQILDHARQFPMMSPWRVVIVKEAQGIKDLKQLESYMASPSPQTILVLAHKKKLDGRIKWVKDAKKADNICMMSSAVVPEYKLSKWISSYLKAEKLSASPEAIEMIANHLGNDLKKVTNEISKIKINIDQGTLIEESHIEKYVGVSKDYDIYALLKALSQGNISRVHEITYNIEANEKVQPLPMIIPGMAAYFERVLIVAQHLKKDDRSLASMIGVYDSFVKEYRMMANRFGLARLIKIYELLVKADGYAKGYGRKGSTGILKELIGTILLYQRAA